MDQYEFRGYDGWHRHVTFACAALALLTVASAHSLGGMPMQRHDLGSSSLVEFMCNECERSSHAVHTNRSKKRGLLA